MTITIESVMQRLAYGHLQGLAMSAEGTGTIRETDQPKIVLGINNVLSRLSTKFDLSIKELRLGKVRGRLSYPLVPEYAVSTQEPSVIPHILDTINDPFLGDVAVIMAAYDFMNRPLPLERRGRRGPGPYITDEPAIVFPYEAMLEGPYWTVRYRAKLPTYDIMEFDPLTPIPLPTELHSALLAGIAADIFSNMNGQEHLARGATLEQQFNTLSDEVVLGDPLGQASTGVADRFHDNGWV